MLELQNKEIEKEKAKNDKEERKRLREEKKEERDRLKMEKQAKKGDINYLKNLATELFVFV